MYFFFVPKSSKSDDLNNKLDKYYQGWNKTKPVQCHLAKKILMDRERRLGRYKVKLSRNRITPKKSSK